MWPVACGVGGRHQEGVSMASLGAHSEHVASLQGSIMDLEGVIWG